MVELRLDTAQWQSFAKDHYISVRVGEVQKLAKLSASRTYKFPQSVVANKKYGKVEIFRRVGSAVVCVDPASDNHEVEVDVEGSKICFDAEVTEPGVAKSAPSPKKETPTTVSQKAAAYLEEHHLEVRLSDAMQAVLRERPADPAAFLAEMLMKNSHIVAKLPKAGPSPKVATSAAVDLGSPAPAQSQKVSSFSQYYAQNFSGVPMSDKLLAQFQAKAVPRPTFKATAPSPATSPKAPAVTQKMIRSPSIGTWLTPTPFSFQKAAAAAGAPAAPAAPAAGSSAKVTEKKFHMKPSVGTWLAKPQPVAKVNNDQQVKPKQFNKLPSVGTWLATAPPSEATKAAPSPAAAAAPATTSSPAPAVSVQPAPQAYEMPAHIVSNVSMMGGNFWGMGLQPSFSFI